MTTETVHSGPGIEAEKLVRMYRQMVAIRLFEERVNDLYTRALMPGLAHLYIGEEAVAVGICEALRRDDYITSTHRGHGHCLAKGAEPHLMFAELLGKEAGYCKGKGGSMHIADPATGNLGANAIVGGGAGIATGAAFSAKYLGTGQVAVCFFGEGALGQGVLYEEMNLAQLWKLPVIYACENNMYNEYTHFSEVTAGDIIARPAAFGVAAETVDGQDVRAVHTAATTLVERARRGDGPGFLLLNTYRYRGHHVGDIAREYYRSKQEEQRWMSERDPIALHAARSSPRVRRTRPRSIASSRRWPRRWMPRSSSPSTLPIRTLERSIRTCMPETASVGRVPAPKAGSPPVREIGFGEAIREALAEEMRRDPRVVLLGEDVAEAGTPFKVVKGLVEEFGTKRVIDTPISEAGFTGLGVGAAMTGVRPVVDIMFGDFLALVMDQVVNQAAKVHYMSGGKWKVPLVVRATMGATRRSAAQHSQSLHAWPSHVPGLKVAIPSTRTMPRDSSRPPSATTIPSSSSRTRSATPK